MSAQQHWPCPTCGEDRVFEQPPCADGHTADGLAVSFLSQLVEVPEAREALRTLVGAGHAPLAVLRLGHGLPAGRTPRRPLAEQLLPD